MKFEQIIQVLTLAETGSFSATARQLYLSQSNLSQFIKQLESELGNQIFKRTSTGLIPTPFGQGYLRQLRQIYAQVNALDNYCMQYNADQCVSMNVAITKCNWVNAFFSKIINENSDKQLQFSLYNTELIDRAMELVESSVCTMAIIGISSPERKLSFKKISSMGLTYTKFFSVPMKIILGKGNPLYNSDHPLSLDALAQFPYVNYGSPWKMDSRDILHTLGLYSKLRSFISVNTNSALYDVVASTQAFTISANTLGIPPRPDVKAFPLEDCPEWIEYGWLKKTHSVLTPCEASLIAKIHELQPAAL